MGLLQGLSTQRLKYVSLFLLPVTLLLEELGLAPGQYMLSAKGETCLHLVEDEKGGGGAK